MTQRFTTSPKDPARWETSVVFIDEVQFFPRDEFVASLSYLANNTLVSAIHLYGLNLDARGQEWPTVSAVLPFATEINLLTSVCWKCAEEALRTQRLSPWPGSDQIAPGAAQDYAPACVECWSPDPIGF